MSWSAIEINHVRLSPAETAVLHAIQGNDTVCTELLANVVGEFRDAIAAAGTALGPSGTIPDLVRTHVINRTRWQWLCEFPQLKTFQTEAREKLNTAAEAALEKILARELRVPPGDGSSADQSPSPAFGSRGGSRATDPAARDFNRTNQDG